MFFPPVSHRPEDPILFCIDELLNMYDGDDPELTFAGTEDEVAAASKIQAMNRGKLARKELQEQSDAATKMQAVQRGKAARKSIGGAEAGEPATADAAAAEEDAVFEGTEDEVAAASKIQAMNRGKLARKELQEQSDAATKMQAVQRGKAARKSIGGAEAGEPATADAGPEETAS